MRFLSIKKFSRRNFTIVELLIAMGIFSFLMVVTFGIYTVAIQRHYDAQKIQAVNQELRYAIELMSRDIKDSRLRGGSSTSINLAHKSKLDNQDYFNCVTTATNCLMYQINTSSTPENNGIFVKQGTEDANPVRLTSQDIEILSGSRFYVDASSAPQDNPKVTILIIAKERNDKKYISRIYLQTTVTQKNVEEENIYQ